MRLLWVISNWKRTGPVEPSLDLAAAVAAAGHEVRVVAGRAPGSVDAETGNTAQAAARARGLSVVDASVRLGKHRNPVRDWADARRLRGVMDAVAPDVVVATLPNALRIAARARGERALAYLSFEDAGARAGLPACDVVFALGAAQDADGTVALDPALDIEGLAGRVGDTAAVRAALGVAGDGFLFGIVARMQTHRRFELLWDALAALKAEGADFRLAAIGRGTNQEPVAFAPVREMGLEDRVVFPGYLRGDAYATALAALDAQLFLVPGSDPTCRALREGMALGVPSIVTTRGMLPSIVEDGVTGRVVGEETPAAWAAALRSMCSDRGAARLMGEAAALRARERFAAPMVAAAFIDRLTARA